MNPPTEKDGDKEGGEEAPPFLSSWRNVYLLVLGSLAGAIALLTLFSRLYE